MPKPPVYSIAVSEQSDGQVSFAVHRVKQGKELSPWVTVYSFEDPNAPPINEAYLPVDGDSAGPFSIAAEASEFHAFVNAWPAIYDPVSEVLVIET